MSTSNDLRLSRIRARQFQRFRLTYGSNEKCSFWETRNNLTDISQVNDLLHKYIYFLVINRRARVGGRMNTSGIM